MARLPFPSHRLNKLHNEPATASACPLFGNVQISASVCAVREATVPRASATVARV
jgi:hypothetical protein